MPNYETHYNIGSKAGGALAVVFGLTTLVTTFDWVWTFFAVLVAYYATVIVFARVVVPALLLASAVAVGFVVYIL
jgi:hypothetical protein